MIQLPQIQSKASVHLFFLLFRAPRAKNKTAPGRRLRRIASFTDFFVCQSIDHLSEGVLGAFGCQTCPFCLQGGQLASAVVRFHPSHTTQTASLCRKQNKHGGVPGWEKGNSKRANDPVLQEKYKNPHLVCPWSFQSRASINNFLLLPYSNPALLSHSHSCSLDPNSFCVLVVVRSSSQSVGRGTFFLLDISCTTETFVGCVRHNPIRKNDLDLASVEAPTTT